MSKVKELSDICREIGCSMLNKKCPGNPMCTILRKVIPKKLYTAADLEQARADERATCIQIAEKEVDIGMQLAEESGISVDPKDLMAQKIANSIRSLGPIGETREEMEKRVRRETVEKVKKWGRKTTSYDYTVEPTIIMPCYVIGTSTLEAIAEGK